LDGGVVGTTPWYGPPGGLKKSRNLQILVDQSASFDLAPAVAFIHYTQLPRRPFDVSCVPYAAATLFVQHLIKSRGIVMATYIALGTYTDQGFREINQTVKRTEDFKFLASRQGMAVKDVFWMRGQQYDMVTILEGENRATADALLLTMNKKGNIRSQLLRAYSATEMEVFLTTSN
jgi:uncharacterized protein with GYD domain